MPCKLDVAAWVACFALAEIVVIWRWQMAFPNEFLKWSLTMLLGMCCCQTFMLVLATGFSVRTLSTEKGKKIWRNSQVALGLRWMMRHTASSRSKTKVLSDSCTLNNDFYYSSHVACCWRMGDDNTSVMELAAGGWTGCYCVEHSLLWIPTTSMLIIILHLHIKICSSQYTCWQEKPNHLYNKQIVKTANHSHVQNTSTQAYCCPLKSYSFAPKLQFDSKKFNLYKTIIFKVWSCNDTHDLVVYDSKGKGIYCM